MVMRHRSSQLLVMFLHWHLRVLAAWTACALMAFGLAAAQELEPPNKISEPSNSHDPLVWLGARPDFIELFHDDAAWDANSGRWYRAARHVRVVKFSTQFLQAVPDAILLRIVRNLRRQGIALGLESLAQNWYKELPVCGQGVEGYSDPGSANQIVAKLKRVEGRLDYIAMDEPLWFGHYYRGKNACMSSIQNVAKRVAVIIGIYTSAFPNVVVGDIEPFPALVDQPNWAADYAEWVKEFHLATGTRLAFLHMDFNWGDPRLNQPGNARMPDAQAIAQMASDVAFVVRTNGLQVGMICNGNDDAVTGELWMRQARAHIDYVKASGINPDHVTFESWVKHPGRTLPDADEGSLSNLVLYYFRP